MCPRSLQNFPERTRNLFAELTRSGGSLHPETDAFRFARSSRKHCILSRIMPDNLTIRIGNISIALASDIPEGDLTLTGAYGPFTGRGQADLTLRLRRGAVEVRAEQRVFDCPPIWTLYRRGATAIIKIFAGRARLERTLVLPPPIKNAELYFSPTADRFIDPFFGPTLELLMLNYLARGRGVVLHACGIDRNGSGILFVGESGAGKSTLANLWRPEAGVDVLSDDRVIVRREGDRFRLYGTPWHGTAGFASARSLTLKRIFFIKHGRENSIADAEGADPVSRLMTCSFPPFWDPRGLTFTLDLFAGLAARVPCRELTFKPDKSVIEFIIRNEG